MRISGIETAAVALALLAVVSCSKAESPQVGVQPVSGGASSAPLLTEGEVKAKYRTCAVGYYSGPQPGKARYTKDTFTWTVTPEFAAAFCMPPSFVSKDLLGIEALAYRMVEDQDEETCGWGGRQEVCLRTHEHHFELYFKPNTFEKLRDVRYQYVAHLPSAMLLTENPDVSERRRKQTQANPVVGAAAVFSPNQFELVSVVDGDKTLSLGSLLSTIYYGAAKGDLDYTRLEGGSGFTKRSVWQRAKSGVLAILVKPPYRGQGPEPQTQRYTSAPLPIPAGALVIKLPKAIAERAIENDVAHGFDAAEVSKLATQRPTAQPVK